MRFVYSNGQLDLQSKGSKPGPGRKVAPWFSYPQRKTRHDKIIFGHWAALNGETGDDNLLALDTGCVWGEKMTLYRLPTDAKKAKWYHCDCS
jgi:bis(5'-nucleosyl)-tetraphosphatase (symmetrical)